MPSKDYRFLLYKHTYVHTYIYININKKSTKANLETKPKSPTLILSLLFVYSRTVAADAAAADEQNLNATMATYDLTQRIAPNLDRHLVFPLLEFLQERQMYPDEQILKSKIELLNKTNMVDYAMDIHKSLYHTEDVPQDMVERRVEVVARLKALEERAAPIVSFLQNPNSFQDLRANDQHYNLQMLNDRYQVSFCLFLRFICLNFGFLKF